MANKKIRNCFYCGLTLTEKTATRDHFYPKSRGYKGRGNLVDCCRACNQAKGYMGIEEFKKTTYYRFYCKNKIFKNYKI